jgi:hypothetical protein
VGVQERWRHELFVEKALVWHQMDVLLRDVLLRDVLLRDVLLRDVLQHGATNTHSPAAAAAAAGDHAA